jgi:hypothetical protein
MINLIQESSPINLGPISNFFAQGTFVAIQLSRSKASDGI